MATKKTPLPISGTTCKRPPYEMPFSYFPDADEQHWKDNGVYDIEAWVEFYTTQCCGEEFLVPQRDGLFVDETFGSPFKKPFYRASEIEGQFSGHPAFIICPGPSLEEVDLEAFRGCLTIAVNSAGFAFKPYLWAIAEAGYMNWFHKKLFPPSSSFLWNARSAFRYLKRQSKLHGATNLWRKNNLGSSVLQAKLRSVFIHKWEEEKTIPPRTSAPTTTSALVAAWKLGCDSAYVVGMDLSKPRGLTYIKSVPHTRVGADATFRYQLKALGQFHIPGFTVYNGSPHSQREDLPFVPVTYEEITDIARSSDDVPKIESFI